MSSIWPGILPVLMEGGLVKVQIKAMAAKTSKPEFSQIKQECFSSAAFM
jgi:hypothetical protein